MTDPEHTLLATLIGRQIIRCAIIGDWNITGVVLTLDDNRRIAISGISNQGDGGLVVEELE